MVRFSKHGPLVLTLVVLCLVLAPAASAQVIYATSGPVYVPYGGCGATLYGPPPLVQAPASVAYPASPFETYAYRTYPVAYGAYPVPPCYYRDVQRRRTRNALFGIGIANELLNRGSSRAGVRTGVIGGLFLNELFNR